LEDFLPITQSLITGLIFVKLNYPHLESEAVETALALKPKVVIPMHHPKADPQAFKRRVEAKSNIRVVPLGIGETFILK
jgi:L-ascorbate metabolism protein UlaG (beta-lactamase superfamily)